MLTALATALVCLATPLAVSPQSFWIDEALTGVKAAQPTLAACWQQMVAERHSDLQMPFYMLYAWVWARLFGISEWALRAANLPWFITGALAFAVTFRGRSRVLAAAMATLSSFAWFYLDEARPYAMQLGAGLLIAASTRQLASPCLPDKRGRMVWGWAFCVGVGVLAGSSLLGIVWCAPAIFLWGAMLGSRGAMQMWRSARPAWLGLGVWLGGLMVYYAWTLKAGARASAAATTHWQSLAFIVYELLGFGGSGPGRLEIREGGVGAFRAHALTLVLFGGLATALLGVGVAGLWRQQRARFAMIAGLVLGTAAVLLAAGWALHFRVLGRHCAPAFAGVVLVLVVGAQQAWESQGRWRRTLVVGFLLVSLASCLSIRFAARHQKDDYRGAAVVAKHALAEGRVVWWSADRSGAEFYGLPVCEFGSAMPGAARWSANVPATVLAAEPLPDLVITSKPDLYDIPGTLRPYLAQERFEVVARLPAFSMWKRGH